jgi:tetratricopeptide (TPR) repeat protein
MRKDIMKVKFRWVLAQAVALALGVSVIGGASLVPSTPAYAQDKAAGEKKVSRAVAKPLKAAQDAMNAKPPKYAEALARLKEVQAISGKTPYDEHIMNEMLGYVYYRQNNYAEAAKAYEYTINSGFLEPADVPNRLQALSTLYYQTKNYDKAIDYASRLVKSGNTDENVITILSQAYYLKNDFKNTLKVLEPYVDQQIKRGQKPKDDRLELLRSACVKLEDQACQERALEKLVAYYPKPEYWQQLLYTMFQSPDINKAGGKSLLHVYRLASEVDVLTRHEDYTEMAQLAIEQGLPGEAERILQKGFEKNVFPDQRTQDKNRRLLESAKKQAASDRATLAKLDSDAAASATGDKDIGAGLAYLSYEQYDKAIEAFNRGLGKGGVRNEAEARLLLGIAQLEAGNKDEAMKAFKQVKGDANLERLANLWSLHARQA